MFNVFIFYSLTYIYHSLNSLIHFTRPKLVTLTQITIKEMRDQIF